MFRHVSTIKCFEGIRWSTMIHRKTLTLRWPSNHHGPWRNQSAGAVRRVVRSYGYLWIYTVYIYTYHIFPTVHGKELSLIIRWSRKIATYPEFGWVELCYLAEFWPGLCAVQHFGTWNEPLGKHRLYETFAICLFDHQWIGDWSRNACQYWIMKPLLLSGLLLLCPQNSCFFGRKKDPKALNRRKPDPAKMDDQPMNHGSVLSDWMVTVSDYPWRIHGAGIYANIKVFLLMGSMEHHFSSSTVRIRHG